MNTLPSSPCVTALAALCALVPLSAPASSAEFSQAEFTRADFTQAELLEDLSLLRSTLEKTHPSIYRYTDRARMDALFDQARRELHDDMTLLQFQRAVVPAVAEIRCSHTSWDLPRAGFGALMGSGRFLPLSVQFLGGALHVRKNLSGNPAVPVAAEILSINGTPTDELVRDLFRFTPTDGLGTALRYRTLERMFSINYRMYVGDAPAFTLELLVDGRVTSVELAALPYGEMRTQAAKTADPPRDDGPALSLNVLADGYAALLTIKTFSESALLAADLDYEAFLERSFQRIAEQGVRHLILDLRDNEGGDDDFGTMLFAYLISEPTAYYASHTFRARDYADFAATDLLESPVFQDFAQRIDPTGARPPLTDVFDEMVRLGWDHDLTPPREPGFGGSLSILMNGFTGSTAAELVTMAELHAGATLIGEEAAGAKVGCSGGLFTTLTLPHSGMSFRIPVFQYRNAVPADTPVGQCPQPDHRVIPGINHQSSDDDPALRLALELLIREGSPWNLPSFEPPLLLETARMRLEPLAPRHVELDYAALMGSREHLQRTLRWGSWPPDGFTLEENRGDLQKHWREFEQRVGFAYTVLTPDRQRCLGCIYLTPIAPGDFENNRALLAYWVIEDELATDLDRHLLDEVMTWLERDWPFEVVGLLVHDDNARGAVLARGRGLEVAADVDVPDNQVYRWVR